jgi:hypothetical protein
MVERRFRDEISGTPHALMKLGGNVELVSP